MKPLFVISFAAILFACNSNKTKENSEVKETTATVSETTPVAPQVDAEKAKVSFKVNDTLARTAKGTHANDQEEQLGMYTEATKLLSLSFMGDISSRPHRGWLAFSISGFKFEPGSYSVSKDNHALFTRYETENAGLPTDYSASGYDIDKGTEMSLSISKIVPDPDSFNGRNWLASGTFSANMLIKEANPYKRTSNDKLTITEGTFENVRIAGGPKAN